jgi:hypothetical protein
MDRIRDPSPKGKETIIRVGLQFLGIDEKTNFDQRNKPMQADCKSKFVDITIYHDKFEVKMNIPINHV